MAEGVAVIGAGIVGLCTAYALTELGAPVTVFERGVPGNGQSGGESRIFRHTHYDGRLVELAVEARRVWREWEERFGRELLSAGGVVAIGSGVEKRLAVLRQADCVSAREIGVEELAQRLPLLARCDGPAMLDEDGGAIRTGVSIEALAEALGDRLTFDEVMSVRTTPSETVELRAGGVSHEYGAVVVCAGRGTAPLARGAGLSLPVSQSAHVRLTYRIRGRPPGRLACLLDGGGVFSPSSAYADPLPGNRAYAVGLARTPVHEDGGLVDPGGLAAVAERTSAYVSRALPGVDPHPVEARHCWVTELPWGPDGIAVWRIGGLLMLAGNHLFKHAPALGRALARAALGEELPPMLKPQARLGESA